MLHDRVFGMLRGLLPFAAILGISLVSAGCPTPPKKDELAEPVVYVFVPETHQSLTLDKFPLQLEVKAEKDGTDETRPTRILFERGLLGKGLRLAAPGSRGNAYAQVRAFLDLRATKVMDLGAGRVQVEGEGDVRVVQLMDAETIGSAPLSAMSGANSEEADATRAVLREMCAAAADLVHGTVVDYAATFRVKVVTIDMDSDKFNIDEFGNPLKRAIRESGDMLLTDYKKSEKTVRGLKVESARLTIWLAPDYEGDLAQFIRETLERSDAGSSSKVEMRKVQ